MSRILTKALLAAAVLSAPVLGQGIGGGINAYLLRGVTISASTPSGGDCLVYSSTDKKWEPTACGSGGGGVTSVGLSAPSWFTVSGSPVTSSGTLTFASKDNLTAGEVLASPSSVAGSISLRALVASDLPSLITSSTSGNAATATALAATPSQCIDGKVSTGIAANGDANCTAGGGTGTVTSVGLSMPSWFTVSGSPVTTSGTLTVVSATGQAKNEFVATPNGSDGSVSLRSIVAADLPTNITSNTSGNAATATACATTTGCSPVASVFGRTGTVSLETSDVTALGELTNDTSGNAATATALATSPSQCTTGEFATGVAASGNANCATPSGAGTVTSVGLSMPDFFTVSGSPVTSNGTLAVDMTAGEPANEFLATPNGLTGKIALRALSAADLPSSITSSTSGNAATATALATTPNQCASGEFATGIAASGNANCDFPSGGGMTNPMTSLGDIIIGGTGGTPERLAEGTTGYVLTSNGSSSQPSWQAATGGSGKVVYQITSTVTNSGNYAPFTGDGEYSFPANTFCQTQGEIYDFTAAMHTTTATGTAGNLAMSLGIGIARLFTNEPNSAIGANSTGYLNVQAKIICGQIVSGVVTIQVQAQVYNAPDTGGSITVVNYGMNAAVTTTSTVGIVIFGGNVGAGAGTGVGNFLDVYRIYQEP